ncbi:UDP-galactose-4-epimerase [Intrasporangium chromatireducens Q5-1]|uniref:UDP-glucose 4-epimerase n=1 Tax=Intrasporangium chromatireducens Q5-1 TaxID=584657 RepID=W9GRT5_9MICO|nr:UDP-glucose 4-epimerase GalE [Intrasporangium chromatireducens]EWT07513.1 UDP-galactose-4-epimerase [Intrasporangium chromatireducens Q5-1]
MRVLVSGGAGYIGSHTVVQLVAAGHEVVIVDNFANSKPSVVNRLEALTGEHLPVHSFDLTDHDKTEHLFAHEDIDAVIHFAGLKAVGESVEMPLEYYENNLGSTFSLVRAMQRHGVDKLVFSSSATVYGLDQEAATEDRSTSATNPYGWTKVMQEQILRDIAVAKPSMRFALLRYFNPVGAHASGTIGEDPQGPPNNLVPYIAQVAVGRREKLQVFGDDYPTADGTPLRDYIHVEDLAAGHLAALTRLSTTAEPVSTWNLGTGRGTSVFEMLHAFERAVGRELPYEVVGRRAGDVAVSFADPSKANAELGWRATRTIDDMCVDTWRWQSQNPKGFPDADS